MGISCCGRASRRRVYGGANAVSVLGRRAVRIDEDVVGRVRARARDLGELGDLNQIGGGAFVLLRSTPRSTPAGGSAAKPGLSSFDLTRAAANPDHAGLPGRA